MSVVPEKVEMVIMCTEWMKHAVESHMFTTNNLLNLSTPLLTGGRGPLINTLTFRELTVYNRSQKSRFSTSDCCFTSLVLMCRMMFFTVGCAAMICRILSVMSETCPWESKVFKYSYCTCFLHLLQQSHLQSEFEAQLLAFSVAFYFLIYS